MTDKEKPTGVATGGLHDLPVRTGLDNPQDKRMAGTRKLALASVRYKMAPLFRLLPRPERDDEQSRAQRAFYARFLTDRIKVAAVSPPAQGNTHPAYVAMVWFEGDPGFTPRWLTLPLPDLRALLNAHSVALGGFSVEPGTPWTVEGGE